ncbi:WD40/YVTN/BNR-like repeat-containing protein [Catellatospora sichuanensis]|uniref:WD40/YVTN/BNR-like repeat-containing protein n=1 Tax=Catellatospora sichuanensis TaxID=1969805 RepID=UPI001FE39AD4|nr:hypothetical protein [Catellatospora sichuanensis]
MVSCQKGCGAITGPLAVDPASGQVFRLSGQPPSPYPPFNVYASPDGALWITYWPGDHPRPAMVARSIDRGATWRTSQAPEGTTSSGVAAVNGQEAYLLTEPLPVDRNEPPPTRPSRLLHTANGGQSWQDVATDLPTSSEVRSFAVGSDGSLMVVDERDGASDLLISRDGGLHFATQRQHTGNGGFGACPGRAWLYDERSPIGTDLVQTTTDGLTWTRLQLPG